GRAAAVSVAAEIGADDGEPSGEPRRDVAPHQMRLRKAVQQHQRRARSETPRKNLRACAGDLERLCGCESIRGHRALNARQPAWFRWFLRGPGASSSALDLKGERT